MDILGEIGVYKNCISLGFFCGTACALSKLGLRSNAGPFDWYFSDYQGVLSQIENDFCDFMHRNNLEVMDNPKIFIDTKYGFEMNHDIKIDFEEEYDEIYEKYKKRVTRFETNITEPTVFFRCIKDDAEIAYINKNWRYAQSIVKRFNDKNEVVYVYREGLKPLTSNVKSFCLGISQYVGELYEMRHMFDKSSELVNFCNGLLPKLIVKKNIIFDKASSQRSAADYVYRCVEGNVNGIDKLILDALNEHNLSKIYLWGAGNRGISLARYLRTRGILVEGIIDNYPRVSEIDGFAIVPLEKVGENPKIFITVVGIESNDSIENQIKEKFDNATIARYMDLE